MFNLFSRILPFNNTMADCAQDATKAAAWEAAKAARVNDLVLNIQSVLDRDGKDPLFSLEDFVRFFSQKAVADEERFPEMLTAFYEMKAALEQVFAEEIKAGKLKLRELMIHPEHFADLERIAEGNRDPYAWMTTSYFKKETVPVPVQNVPSVPAQNIQTDDEILNILDVFNIHWASMLGPLIRVLRERNAARNLATHQREREKRFWWLVQFVRVHFPGKTWEDVPILLFARRKDPSDDFQRAYDAIIHLKHSFSGLIFDGPF